MTALLDSTLLIDALRKRPEATSIVIQFVKDGSPLATSAVNVAEVYAGMRKEEESAAQAFFDGLLVLDVTPSIAVLAGRLKNNFARKGQTREITDMIVAATALEFDLTVVTNNRRDFKGTGVKLHGVGEN